MYVCFKPARPVVFVSKKKSNIVQEFNSPMGSTDMLTISAMCGEKKVFQKFS